MMLRNKCFAVFAMLALPAVALHSQSGPSAEPSSSSAAAAQVTTPASTSGGSGGAFKHFALGAGVSPLGINLMAATAFNNHVGVRAYGNVFSYSIKNLSTNGFNINGDLDLASAGAAVDFYPWGHGLRLSPGVLFYNTNQVSGSSTVAAGQSFELNGTTYYSSKTDPVTGTASVNLHTTPQAFTITAGWGSIVSHKPYHLSVPFEIGVALAGAPQMKMNLTGSACDPTFTVCIDVAQNAQIQSNLAAQLVKYNNDLEPLKTYPIALIGLAYTF